MYTETYHKAYPSAKLIGVEPLIKKLGDKVKWSGVYGRDADPLEGAWYCWRATRR
jgi:hypothetical protein